MTRYQTDILKLFYSQILHSSSHLIIDFIATFHRIETVALTQTRKILENIYREQCHSQQIYKKWHSANYDSSRILPM